MRIVTKCVPVNSHAVWSYLILLRSICVFLLVYFHVEMIHETISLWNGQTFRSKCSRWCGTKTKSVQWTLIDRCTFPNNDLPNVTIYCLLRVCVCFFILYFTLEINTFHSYSITVCVMLIHSFVNFVIREYHPFVGKFQCTGLIDTHTHTHTHKTKSLRRDTLTLC